MNCSPAGTQLGKRKLINGTVLVLLMTVKLTTFVVPPPGAGLVTVTAGAPADAMLAAGMAAVNCTELMKEVATVEPPKLTIEPRTKFVPVIVSVKAAPPAAAVFGEIMLIVGLTDAGWLPEPPHPARSTIVAIPKITSVLHRQEGPLNASGEMACSSAIKERGPVGLANAIFMGSTCFVSPPGRNPEAKDTWLPIYVIGKGGQKTTG